MKSSFFIFFIMVCVSSSFFAAQSDYAQFVDIEQYQLFDSRPCQEEQAQTFLNIERKKFAATKKIAQYNQSPCILVNASIELYLATEIALKSNSIEIGKPTIQNYVQSIGDDCCSKSRSLELRCIKSSPIFISSCFVEQKANIAMMKLFFRSQQKEKKE